MPKGPKGQKRPADVVGAAITVAKIATGEITDETDESKKKDYARRGGLKGGKARAKALTAEQRRKIAQKAAKARWEAQARREKKEHQEP